MPTEQIEFMTSENEDSDDSFRTQEKLRIDDCILAIDDPEVKNEVLTQFEADEDSVKSQEPEDLDTNVEPTMKQTTLTQYVKSYAKQEHESPPKIKKVGSGEFSRENFRLHMLPYEKPNVQEASISDLIKDHFKGELIEKDIPNWDIDESFINKIRCPIPIEFPCTTCEKLCFSTELRGKPTRDVEWYKNVMRDSASEYQEMHFYYIRYKFNRFSLPLELRLRNMTRDQIYKQLIERFRGFYDEENSEDDIDFILSLKHWSSMEKYYDWKDKYDYTFQDELPRVSRHNLYCTGCGIIAIHDYDEETKRGFQRCADKDCDFVLYDDKEVARVRSVGYVRQQKLCKDDVVAIKRIDKAIRTKTIPEKGFEGF